MIVEDARRWALSQIAPQRRAHVEGVVSMMEQYAARWAFPLDAGVTVAWVHDVCRDWPEQRLLAAAEEQGLRVSELERAYPLMLHGPVAAGRFRRRFAGCFGNSPSWLEDGCRAVFFHTTGRPGMSSLESCLYLADAVEAGREYPGVEEIRELSFRDLEAAVLLSMDRSLTYLIERGHVIHPLTVAARNAMIVQ